MPSSSRVVSKSVFFLVAFEFSRFVNSARYPFGYILWHMGNCSTTYFRNCVEEYVLCSFVCLENSEAAVLVYEGVLIEFLLCHFPDETTLWNKFHIYLAFLTRICHLFIGFWGIFRIWEA